MVGTGRGGTGVGEDGGTVGVVGELEIVESLRWGGGRKGINGWKSWIERERKGGTNELFVTTGMIFERSKQIENTL